MSDRSTWVTVWFDSQNIATGKTNACHAATAFVPEALESALMGMHYEYVEAIHDRTKGGEDGPHYLFKRKAI
jgi:hypothetical protein